VTERASAESIGTRIRLARNNREYTQTDLATVVGRTRSSIANIEAGRQAASAAVLVQIADLLGVDAGWLLTGTPADRDAAASSPAC
jgi:transcriptional regulator with XRE-family HTH domain